jgi:DUF1680 family protein
MPERRTVPNPVTGATHVVDTTQSPHSRLRPTPVSSVRITDGFWSERLRRNAAQTLPFAHDKCRSTGALQNFGRAAGKADGPFHGRYYSDSDVYKWVESASWSLASVDDPDLRRRLDETVALIADAQDVDGYLNTYFSVDRVDQRWSDLVVRHEMYCLGHLIQAAVAHHRVTGDTTLLDVGVRAAELVASRFPPGESYGACGHPNLEMALVELARETGDHRWLELAEWQLESRGRGVLDGSEYLLDHEPVRSQRRVTGHAVRALYLYAAMADVVLETGDAELAEALDELWTDLVHHKTSVTGGVGARWDGESFGDEYELPDRAYNETCAAIASIHLAWRMLLRTGDGQYREVIEWALYNAVLPGLSADGTRFFYQNPLADAGRHRRQPWFDCACCPPNITRMLASLPGYVLGSADAGLWLHLLVSAEAAVQLPGAGTVQVRTSSGLPYDGDLELRLGLDGDHEFTVRLPAPSWASGQTVMINGDLAPYEIENGYLVITRNWQDQDTISVNYQTPVRLLTSHPRVGQGHQRVAVTRGPLVYCVEQADHDHDVRDLRLAGTEEWKIINVADLPEVTALSTEGLSIEDHPGTLHHAWSPDLQPSHRSAPITAIPYFAWANREAGPMTVLLPVMGYQAGSVRSALDRARRQTANEESLK